MVETALRTSDLIDSLGVATHIDYTDSSYADISRDINSLNYLGIHQVRDSSPNPASDQFGQGHLGDAAAAGVQFTFIAQGGTDPLTVVSRLHDFVAAHPGAISGIEGPNEVNNWQINYNGLSGTAGAQAYQQALYNAVKADNLLHDVPVLGFTDYPQHASASDWNNIHPYPKDGDEPRSAIVNDINGQAAVDPGKPFAITEMGYFTSQSDSSGNWESVDQATQASLTLNAYMDSVQLGSKATFLYELLDEQPDASGNDMGAHFGLFNNDGTPKLAATAIHNLTSILADNSANANSFAASTLEYSTQGLAADGHSLLTQKGDGSYQIIVWNEPDLWNQDANTAINVAESPVTINLGQVFGKVQVFDPLQGADAIMTLDSVSSINVGLKGHPLVVQVSQAGAAVTAPPATHTDTAAGTTPDTTTTAAPTTTPSHEDAASNTPVVAGPAPSSGADATAGSDTQNASPAPVTTTINVAPAQPAEAASDVSATPVSDGAANPVTQAPQSTESLPDNFNFDHLPQSSQPTNVNPLENVSPPTQAATQDMGHHGHMHAFAQHHGDWIDHWQSAVHDHGAHQMTHGHGHFWSA